MMLILPLIFTLGGEIQNILLFFNLEMAKDTPTDIVAGKAGGTVIVIKSNDLSTILLISNPSGLSLPYWIKVGKVNTKPNIPTIAIAPTNTSES
jgi:hypothetical protein